MLKFCFSTFSAVRSMVCLLLNISVNWTSSRILPYPQRQVHIVYVTNIIIKVISLVWFNLPTPYFAWEYYFLEGLNLVCNLFVYYISNNRFTTHFLIGEKPMVYFVGLISFLDHLPFLIYYFYSHKKLINYPHLIPDVQAFSPALPRSCIGSLCGVNA